MANRSQGPVHLPWRSDVCPLVAAKELCFLAQMELFIQIKDGGWPPPVQMSLLSLQAGMHAVLRALLGLQGLGLWA